MIKSGDYQYILLTDGTAELTNYTAYAKVLTVPAQIDGHAVVSIGRDAFTNSELLSNITLPDYLTTIGIDAFYECSSLTSITLPNSLTAIGDYAFQCCSALTSITLPNKLTSLGQSAFDGCSGLTSIYSPANVTTIGLYAIPANEGLTIYGAEGSAAEEYADGDNIKFVVWSPTA